MTIANMGQKVFIPITDELLFDRPDLISAPLRPYSEDLPCYHWLDIEIMPADEASAQNGSQAACTQAVAA